MTTTNCFSNLIVIENLFCINRSFLIDSPRKKLISNSIFIVTISLLITVVIIDVLSSNASFATRAFQGLLAVEFFNLMIAAKFRSKSFDALKRLDEKCGISDDYINKLVTRSNKYIFFIIFCAVMDVTGLMYEGYGLSMTIIYLILYSAPNAELLFFSLVIVAINERLLKLKNASPVIGSKVYRHVLVTTAAMNEEVTPRMILLLLVTLGTTVTYFTVLMLSLTDTGVHVFVFILWRELKVFFCLWRVCYEAARTEAICQQLAFQLAQKLALDPAFDKAKNRACRATLGRWQRAVVSQRPRFLRGTVLAVGLATPLHLLDLSVNYVLIIVQIYVAYN